MTLKPVRPRLQSKSHGRVHSALATTAVVLILVLIVAGIGGAAYFLVISNGGTSPTSTTEALLTSSSASPPHTTMGSTGLPPSTGLSTSAQTVSSSQTSTSGSVRQTLILYNNTLEAGSPEIADTTFVGNYSTISILDTIYDPSNGYAYVSGLNSSELIGNGVVLAVSPSTNHVVAVIHVTDGDTPDQLTYDSNNGYIYGTGSATDGSNITIIDANNNTALPNISPYGSAAVPCGGGFYLDTASSIAYDSSANVVYTIYGCGDGITLATLNPVTDALSAGMTLPVYIRFGALLYDPSNQLLYATSDSEQSGLVSGNALGNVTAINPATGATVATIHVGVSPSGVALDPSNSEIYVSSEENVTAISATTNSKVATISLPRGVFGPTVSWGIAFDSGTGYLYVTTGGEQSTLVTIDAATNAVAGTIATNFPTYTVTYAPSGNEVLVGDNFFGVLDVVS